MIPGPLGLPPFAAPHTLRDSWYEVGVTPEAATPGRRSLTPQASETARHLRVSYSHYLGVPPPITNGGLNEHGVAVRDVWSPSHERLSALTPPDQTGPNTDSTWEKRSSGAWTRGAESCSECARSSAGTAPRSCGDQVLGDRPSVALDREELAEVAVIGIWEFGWWCGPSVSSQATAAAIERYLGVFATFIDELLA